MSLLEALAVNRAVRQLMNKVLNAMCAPEDCSTCKQFGYVWWICPPSHKGQKCLEHRE